MCVEDENIPNPSNYLHQNHSFNWWQINCYHISRLSDMSVWWTFKAINLNVGDIKLNKFTSHSKESVAHFRDTMWQFVVLCVRHDRINTENQRERHGQYYYWRQDVGIHPIKCSAWILGGGTNPTNGWKLIDGAHPRFTIMTVIDWNSSLFAF